MRRRDMWRMRRDRLPAPPLVWMFPRLPELLTEREALEIAGAARPLGDLHELFWERHVADAPRPKRGPYRPRAPRRQGASHADRT